MYPFRQIAQMTTPLFLHRTDTASILRSFLSSFYHLKKFRRRLLIPCRDSLITADGVGLLDGDVAVLIPLQRDRQHDDRRDDEPHDEA